MEGGHAQLLLTLPFLKHADPLPLPPFVSQSSLKPWPNGVASYCKLKTCINLRLRLAMTCVHLRWLAMTCVHFDRAQICTRVNTTQVFTVWPPNANRRKLVSVLFPLSGRTEIAFLLLALNLRLRACLFCHTSQVCVRKFTFPNLR